MFKRLLICILTFLLSINAFAYCETERSRFENARALCLSLSATSVGVATGGGLLLPVIGGLFGLVPALPAFFACREMEERGVSLDSCLRHAQRSAETSLREQAAQEEIQRRAQEREQRTCAINQRYDQLRQQAEAIARTEIQQMIQTMVDDGFDVNNSETQEVIHQSRQEIQNRLNQELNRLETERRQEVGR